MKPRIRYKNDRLMWYDGLNWYEISEQKALSLWEKAYEELQAENIELKRYNEKD